jgi:hypothetical protein
MTLLPLSVFLKEVKRTNLEGHVFLEDKSAAFDSISFTHMEMSLKRIAIPQNVIKIYMTLIKNRNYGPSLHTDPQTVSFQREEFHNVA